jgi:putative transposase
VFSQARKGLVQCINHSQPRRGVREVASVPQSFACLHTHLVISTKQRARLITPELSERLYPYLGGILRNRKCQLVHAGGMPDHIHLLVNQARDISVSELVRDIKANSSGWIHESFPEHQGFAWQQGYAAFSVSKSGMASVGSYIDNQADHHRTRSYQEELMIMLAQHEIEYDERYMWE